MYPFICINANVICGFLCYELSFSHSLSFGLTGLLLLNLQDIHIHVHMYIQKLALSYHMYYQYFHFSFNFAYNIFCRNPQYFFIEVSLIQSYIGFKYTKKFQIFTLQMYQVFSWFPRLLSFLESHYLMFINNFL